jgi:copper chaperone NosL
MVFKRLMLFLFCLFGLFVISGCDNSPPAGPAKVRWDREICERCRMLISDRNFAAQYRDGKGKVHLFDDLGEMILSFQEKTNSDPELQLYVNDADSGEWLDVRKAYFTVGHLTPMGFGYGAHKIAKPESIDFTVLVKKIAAGEKGAPAPKMQSTMPHEMHHPQKMVEPHAH